MNNKIKNLNRIGELINYSIDSLKLNLSNLIVFTEAASDNFSFTPIIAAKAGAKVFAVAKDSKYALRNNVKKEIDNLANYFGLSSKIQVVFDKSTISFADIVTNLGFVRPIDKGFIDQLNEKAVISYMCEAWEVRDKDIDLRQANRKGIPVMGVNENHPLVNVFKYSGPLLIKMILEAGLEIHKSKIVIVSSDNFGPVLARALENLCENLSLVNNIKNNKSLLINADVIVIADYTSKEEFIGGSEAQITVSELIELSKYVTIIQFAGLVNIDELEVYGVNYYPKHKVGSKRMGYTLAYLGPRPVIELHTAGLKVGELMHSLKRRNLCVSAIENELCYEGSLCQKIIY